MNIKKLIKGVYLIERIIDKKNDDEPIYYVGLSEDIFERWKQHCNENEQYIDKAIQKYGYTNFIFRILETVSKKSELKNCETKWINYYKEKFGEQLMYNISETKNRNPHKLDRNIKKEIKDLFIKDIGRSIYAISEKYNIDWEEVMKIRKPILKQKGLKYDRNVKNIIDIKTNKIPTNWRGYKMTKTLSDKILSLKAANIDDKDIANQCNISITDLKLFYEEYNKKGKQYNFAVKI